MDKYDIAFMTGLGLVAYGLSGPILAGVAIIVVAFIGLIAESG